MTTNRSASASAPRGAVVKPLSWSDRLKGYLRHHQQLFLSTSARLLSEPLQTLMTALVIAIALGLPAAFYAGVLNLQQVLADIETTAQISIFLDLEAEEQSILQLRDRLEATNEIESVTYISRDEALEEFKTVSGFGDVLSTLAENPLPPVLVVKPAHQLQKDLEQSEALVGRIHDMELVDDVRLDMKWMQRLQGFLAVGKRLVLSLAVVLSIGVLLIVGNTIRLAIQNRRQEIVVVKLVGGTNSYVRRPFLHTGVGYGLLGGLLAWLLVQLCLWWAKTPVSQLASLYESSFHLQGLGFLGLLALMVVGAILGVLGAWIAVARHLSQIEPK